jgi:DNA mismatch repair protein MutS2
MDELLVGLQAERIRLAEMNRTVEAEKEKLEARSAELENEIKKLNAERRHLIQEARDNLVAEMAGLQKEVKVAAAALKHERSEEAVNRARRTTQTTRELLKKAASATEAISSSCKDTALTIGDRVWLMEFGVEASIVSINEHSGQIEASSGPLRFQVNRESISKMTASEPDKPIRCRSQLLSKDAPPELDLRGRRADEIELLFDSYLGDAALSGRRSVRIIHGFGTGTVRAIIRDQAARHQLVKSFHAAAPDEGGDGATIIELK